MVLEPMAGILKPRLLPCELAAAPAFSFNWSSRSLACAEAPAASRAKAMSLERACMGVSLESKGEKRPPAYRRVPGVSGGMAPRLALVLARRALLQQGFAGALDPDQAQHRH